MKTKLPSCRTTRQTAARGFTLLEMLVVVLIIGLLTGVVGPRLMAQMSKSEQTAARAQLSAFDKALQAFRIDTGRYPLAQEGLAALVAAPANEPRWAGPYLSGALPADPWGQPYQYRVPGANGRDYEIYSWGKDRAEGGQGDGADVVLP